MSKQTIEIPLQLFLDLLWLQAIYAAQLNAYDAGGRMAVWLRKDLRERLTEREVKVRKEVGVAPPKRGRPPGAEI